MNYSGFLMLLLSNISVLPTLLALGKKFLETTDVAGKIDVLKEILDALKPLAGAIIGPQVASTASEADLESQVCAAYAAMPKAAGVEVQAFDGSRLRKLFEIVGPLLPTLLQLLTKVAA